MTSTTKRRFTDEFKREAVALWETSGRITTEVPAELGIMPTLLRRWQRKLQDSNVRRSICRRGRRRHGFSKNQSGRRNEKHQITPVSPMPGLMCGILVRNP